MAGPESTAERVALWRAMHVQFDAEPHVLEDEVGLQLVGPDDNWRDRPDMDPSWTGGFRAAIVARARFIEDLVEERAAQNATQNATPNATQYVILGAGLDTFAQRKPDVAARLHVFEIDQPEPQAWKERRLRELGYGVPDRLHFVPVDFEADEDWWQRLNAAGFDPGQPTVVASTGVSMYLTRDATESTLRKIAGLAPGSAVAMSFLLPSMLLDEADRPGLEAAARGAEASGTPFISFYTPEEMLDLAREAGFSDVRHVSGAELAERYFQNRADGLRPSTGEDLLVAVTS